MLSQNVHSALCMSENNFVDLLILIHFIHLFHLFRFFLSVLFLRTESGKNLLHRNNRDTLSFQRRTNFL